MSFILDRLLQAGITTTVAMVVIWILRKYWGSYLAQADELRVATEQFFPSGLQPRLEGDQRRIQVEVRANAFYKSYDACRKAIYKNRPFFPGDLDQVLFKILQKAQQVHAHFSNGINTETGEIPFRVFENARPELGSFCELVDDASLRIKEHINV